MLIYTIGFSKKSLKDFISRLKQAEVRKVVDVRLNNTSQLAGYAKKEDLEYILSLVGIAYEHHPELAPTDALLKNYKEKRITWEDYEAEFLRTLSGRRPLNSINWADESEPICFLCSEDKAARCHRRLVAEFYANHLPGLAIKHL